MQRLCAGAGFAIELRGPVSDCTKVEERVQEIGMSWTKGTAHFCLRALSQPASYNDAVPGSCLQPRKEQISLNESSAELL